MKKLKFALLLSLFANWSFAQLVNDGATITIKNGATLFVETDVQNNTGGTITVETGGTLEVQGNFTNAAGTALIDVQGTGKLKFTGAANSNLTTNTDAIRNLEVSKSNSTVTLVDNLTITNNLDFGSATSSHLLLGANNAVLNGTVTGYDNNEFVVTNGAGKLTKNALTTMEYPVGYTSTTYNPISLTQTTADNISVRVLERAYTDGPAATTPITSKIVDASWDITSSGGASSFSSIIPQWATGDEIGGFNRADCGVSKFVSSNLYDLTTAGIGAASAATNPVSDWTRSRTTASGAGTYVVGADNVMTYVSVSAKAFLGAYSASTGLMGDQLRIGASGVTVLPLKEPYFTYDPDGNATPNFIHVGRAAISANRDSVLTQADFDKTGTNDDIVDWVFLQVRNTGSPYAVQATRSALIQRDGDIVGVDGQPVKFVGINAGTYKVAIRHRNHLGVLTDLNKSLSTTPTIIDFANATTPELPLGGLSKMDLISGTFSAYTLTPGDANANGAVQASDLNTYWLPTNGTIYTAPQYTTVGRADWNLNRAVQASDNNNHWLPNNGVLQGFPNN